MWTVNVQMFTLDLEKAEEPEIKLPTSAGSLKKQENSRKTSTSTSGTMLKPLTMWVTTNCGKFFKRCDYQTILPATREIRMQVKKQYDRGWDGWMASPTQWAWIWVISGSWWWTGQPDVLNSMGSQRMADNWATELNWLCRGAKLSILNLSPWGTKNSQGPKVPGNLSFLPPL